MLALFNISSGRLWWYVILWSRSCINFTSSPAQIFSCDKVQLALKHLERMTFFLAVLLLFMPSPSWELETNCKAVFDIFSMVRWGGSPKNLNVLCSIENSLGTIHFFKMAWKHYSWKWFLHFLMYLLIRRIFARSGLRSGKFWHSRFQLDWLFLEKNTLGPATLHLRLLFP